MVLHSIDYFNGIDDTPDRIREGAIRVAEKIEQQLNGLQFNSREDIDRVLNRRESLVKKKQFLNEKQKEKKPEGNLDEINNRISELEGDGTSTGIIKELVAKKSTLDTSLTTLAGSKPITVTSAGAKGGKNEVDLYMYETDKLEKRIEKLETTIDSYKDELKKLKKDKGKLEGGSTDLQKFDLAQQAVQLRIDRIDEITDVLGTLRFEETEISDTIELNDMKKKVYLQPKRKYKTNRANDFFLGGKAPEGTTYHIKGEVEPKGYKIRIDQETGEIIFPNYTNIKRIPDDISVNIESKIPVPKTPRAPRIEPVSHIKKYTFKVDKSSYTNARELNEEGVPINSRWRRWKNRVLQSTAGILKATPTAVIAGSAAGYQIGKKTIEETKKTYGDLKGTFNDLRKNEKESRGWFYPGYMIGNALAFGFHSTKNILYGGGRLIKNSAIAATGGATAVLKNELVDNTIKHTINGKNLTYGKNTMEAYVSGFSDNPRSKTTGKVLQMKPRKDLSGSASSPDESDEIAQAA